MNTISGASAVPSSVQFGRRDHVDSPSAHSPVRAAAHRTRLDQPGVDRLSRDLFESSFRDMTADNTDTHESNAPSLGEVWRAINAPGYNSSDTDASGNDEATLPAASAEPGGDPESEGSSSDEEGSTAHHLMAARRFSPQDDLQSRLERLVRRAQIPKGKIRLNDTKTGVISKAYEKF